MRTLFVVSMVAALAGTASADLVKLDDAIIPPSCRAYVSAPAPTLQLQLANRVSIATCMATIRLDAALHDPKNATQVIQALGDAVSPSITMLDAVIMAGDAP